VSNGRARTMNMAVFYNNSDLDFGAILDGTSHTFLALELSSQTLPNSAIARSPRFQEGTAYANPFVFVNHASQGYAMFTHSGIRDFNVNDLFYVDQPSRAPRSFHAGGLQAAMCDGSVRFVADTVATSPWHATFTRDSASRPAGQGGQNAGGGPSL